MLRQGGTRGTLPSHSPVFTPTVWAQPVPGVSPPGVGQLSQHHRRSSWVTHPCSDPSVSSGAGLHPRGQSRWVCLFLRGLRAREDTCLLGGELLHPLWLRAGLRALLRCCQGPRPGQALPSAPRPRKPVMRLLPLSSLSQDRDGRCYPEPLGWLPRTLCMRALPVGAGGTASASALPLTLWLGPSARM